MNSDYSGCKRQDAFRVSCSKSVSGTEPGVEWLSLSPGHKSESKHMAADRLFVDATARLLSDFVEKKDASCLSQSPTEMEKASVHLVKASGCDNQYSHLSFQQPRHQWWTKSCNDRLTRFATQFWRPHQLRFCYTVH